MTKPKKGKKVIAIEVVEIATGKVVKRIDCIGKSLTQIGMIDLGLLRNMDLERFSSQYVWESIGRKS